MQTGAESAVASGSTLDCAKVVKWLQQKAGLKLLSFGDPQNAGEYLLLKVDVTAVAKHDPEMATHLTLLSEDLLPVLAAALFAAGWLPSETTPYWVQIHVPLPMTDVPQLHRAVPRLQHGDPVSIHGICTAIQPAHDQVYSRTFSCPECELQHIAYGCGHPHLCCPECKQPVRAAHEVLNSRTFKQVQTIWVASIQPAHRGGGAYPAEVAVEIQEPDLGRGIGLGSRVTLFGHISILLPLISPTAPPEQLPIRCFPHVKIVGNVVRRVGSTALYRTAPLLDSWEGWHQNTLGTPHLLLDNLVQAACTCVAWPLLPSLLCSLLLSAASLGTSNDRSPTNGLVHVLVGCEGHVPALIGAMQATAGLLAPTARRHTCPSLLPTFLKVAGPAGETVLQANVGSLHMASQGILLLRLDEVRKKEVQAFYGGLARGRTDQPDGSSVALEAAVWVVHSDLRDGTRTTQKPGGRAMAGGAGAGLWGLPPPVAESMDVVCWLDMRHLEEDIIAHTLNGPDEAEETVRELSACMRHHMGLAAALQPPVISAGAQGLLQLYFLLVRQSGKAQGHMDMLPRLAALATASARLHLRTHVLAFPDAVLAVKVAEESCSAKGESTFLSAEISACQRAAAKAGDTLYELLGRINECLSRYAPEE